MLARQFQTGQYQDRGRQQASGPQGGTSWDLLTLQLRVHAGTIAEEGIINSLGLENT